MFSLPALLRIIDGADRKNKGDEHFPTFPNNNAA
jgi:hypothetical protein